MTALLSPNLVAYPPPRPLDQKQGTARHVAAPHIGEGEIDQFTLQAALVLVVAYAPGKSENSSSGEVMISVEIPQNIPTSAGYGPLAAAAIYLAVIDR